MSLRIALCLSLLLHAAATRLPLPGAGVDPSQLPAGRETLELRLVDPAQTLGREATAEGAPADVEASARRGAAAGGGEDGTAEAVAEASDVVQSEHPARRDYDAEPTLADLEAELGLDLSEVADQGRNRIFPVMLKVHLNDGRPSAATYRQLLRTYIDVLMGYPWAVQGELIRNSDVRFLALLQVDVSEEGRVHVAHMLINENVADETGRIEEFYRRLLREVTTRPFLPPSRAGLESPARLTFQILNPEATR